MNCEHGVRKQSCACCSPHLVYKTYQRSASVRHLSFNLAMAEFIALVNGQCQYCGAFPARGIDRRNNALGYENFNAVSCCRDCNRLKGSMSEFTFLAQVQSIARWQEELRKQRFQEELRKRQAKIA